MYSVFSYGEMIGNAPRMEAYVSALRKTVKPGSVVLDLGTGPGIFALLSCQLGARRVFAVEPDDIIELGRQAALANGFGDRIEFIQDLSTKIELPEKVDVVVSDLRGVLPWHQQHIPSICDVRKRFLAPGGILIPQRDTVWAAVVSAPNQYSRLVSPWEENKYGLNLDAPRNAILNSWRRTRMASYQFLVEPVQWAELNYNELEETNVTAEIGWALTQSGTAHGFVLWFDSELVEGICLTNHPGAPELIYRNAFFPFPRPLALESGDEVKIKISAYLVNENYIWRWDTQVQSKNEGKIDFKQSSFFGVPLPVSKITKRAASYVPQLNEDGEVESFILSLMNGRTSEEIAEQVQQKFPQQFQNSKAALSRVSETSLKYSK